MFDKVEGWFGIGRMKHGFYWLGVCSAGSALGWLEILYGMGGKVSSGILYCRYSTDLKVTSCKPLIFFLLTVFSSPLVLLH